MKAILYYIHDPMCSWCWGFSSTLNDLLDKLPENVEVQRLLGGLAEDSDTPMSEEMQKHIKNNWLRIEETIPNVKFNFDFWKNTIPRRSTYPACRAVIAARQQGIKNDVLMTKAIQNAYYQQALNPSDDSVLVQLASDLGLDKIKFSQALNSKAVQQELLQEIKLSRDLFIESYPSLVFSVAGREYAINIDYNSYTSMYEQIMLRD